MGKQLLAFVGDRDLELALNYISPGGEFPSESFFVHALEQPRATEVAMNLNRGIHNGLADNILSLFQKLCVFAPLRPCVEII